MIAYVKTNESKFLGFTFKAGRIQWHPKTLMKFKQQVRRLTNRNWGVSMQYQLFKLSQYLRGWINYFGITSKGPWRSAKSPGINQALSLDYLKSEGLYSLRDGWVALHHPK